MAKYFKTLLTIGFAPEYLYEIGTYPENVETTPLMAAEEQQPYGNS